ncbi:hypothetical protein GCM10025738_18090 [Microbacterium fluvii]
MPAAAALALLLVLVGCASEPSTTALEDELAMIPGVEGVALSVSHPNAPWNTRVDIVFAVAEPTVESVTTIVREAAPMIVADPELSGHEVAIAVVDARSATADADDADAAAAAVHVMPEVGEALGVDAGGNAFLFLTPEELEAIADQE